MTEVVSIVSETLRNLIVEEAKFLSGVRDEVEEVQAELIRMQCFLKDADSRQQKDETIRNYVKEIRRLAYRIENVLAAYAVEVTSREKSLGTLKFLKWLVCGLTEVIALHKVGSKIENIKKKLDRITTRLQTYGVIKEEEQSSNSNQQLISRRTYPQQVEEYFVGMKDEITGLLSLITDEERSHRVISVYGMGGLGKTTLARKIFNHINVQRCFEAFAWVSISQQFTTKTTLGDILKQLLPSQKEIVMKMEETELVRELYKVQKEIKCLVVLDDLWKVEDWKCLSLAFPFAESNSKVLITTRNQNVAEAEFAYPLNLLNEDDGWELLRKRAFAKKDTKDSEIDPKFEIIGREIVRKCGKLPLAISVLGGILSKKPLHVWGNVSKDVDSYVRRSEGSNEGYGAVLQVLALSYDELSHYLKPCFLYLGNFREDEDIDVEMLYRMWIAEGMISSKDKGSEETLVDVAQEYLSEMAYRSMVQVEVNELTSTSKRFRSCHVHDLMRDFCLAHGKEVEFLKVLDFRKGNDPLSDPSPHYPCRQTIQTDDQGFSVDVDAIMRSLAVKDHGQQLRSLQIRNEIGKHDQSGISFPVEICESQKLKFLKVLNIEGHNFGGSRLPEVIHKFIHLKFLGLNNCVLDELPPSIGQLQYLQTLDIRIHRFTEIKVPNVLWKLKQLKHLYLPSMHSTPKEKLRLNGLSKLETLVKFNGNYDDPRDLSELINLRSFHARARENKSLHEILSYICTNQHKLRETHLDVNYFEFRESAVVEDKLVPLEHLFACLNLHKLTIIWGRCEFQKLQQLDQSLLLSSNITKFTLRCEIQGDPMGTLGKLSNLQKLDMENSKFLDKKMIVCEANSFPKLTSLRFYNVSNLVKWTVLEGAMPNLCHLDIENCSELEMIPDGLRFITSLKELRSDMPKEFNDRLRVIDGKEGADFHKIRHVPFISLSDRYP